MSFCAATRTVSLAKTEAWVRRSAISMRAHSRHLRRRRVQRSSPVRLQGQSANPLTHARRWIFTQYEARQAAVQHRCASHRSARSAEGHQRCFGETAAHSAGRETLPKIRRTMAARHKCIVSQQGMYAPENRSRTSRLRGSIGFQLISGELQRVRGFGRVETGKWLRDSRSASSYGEKTQQQRALPACVRLSRK